MKQKYDDTDFKGGAQNLGKSISDASKRTSAKISKGFKEIKVKEKTEKVKFGFMRFATKVKGLFASKEDSDRNSDENDEESKEVTAQDCSIHDIAKAEL